MNFVSGNATNRSSRNTDLGLATNMKYYTQIKCYKDFFICH
jgi:hypothetical protein